MKSRRPSWRTAALAAAMLVLAACGNDNGSDSDSSTATPTGTPVSTASDVPMTATPTVIPTDVPTTLTPTRTGTPAAGARVSGLVVVHENVAASRGDALGAPPAEWASQVDTASFGRALAFADWTVDGGDRGTTGADGRFDIADLAPGPHSLDVTKTLNGNLVAATIPFAVGPDGRADVIAELSWGMVRSVSTYLDNGVGVREIRSPSGGWLVTRDGRITELGTFWRVLRDPDGDGQFDSEPCSQSLWSCEQDRACDREQVCSNGVCVPPGTLPPYPCNPDGGCAQPGDRCVCVSSCPECDDCRFSACAAACAAVEITAITVSAPSQLILGQPGWSYAAALLSDGSTIDVTALADWQSSDENVATIDSWGTITTEAQGTTDLSARLGESTSDAWPLEVVDRPPLRRIYLQNANCYFPLRGPQLDDREAPVAVPPERSDLLPVPTCSQVILIGSTLEFRAIGEFGASAYYEDITDEARWQAVPPEVGDVVGGVFTGRQAGTTQLTAALGDVVSEATEIRVVAEPTLIGLSIYTDQGVRIFELPPEPGPAGIAAIAEPCFDCGYSVTVLRGDELRFHATAQYDIGEWQDVTDQVTWRSSDPAVATIDSDGVMLAIVAGTAVIDATLEDVVSQPVSVRVVNEATLLSLYLYQEGTDRVVAKNGQAFFHARGYYDLGFEGDVTDEATWRSSDGAVGGFDQPGVFTGRAAGTTTVWAELGGLRSDSVPLEVYETTELSYCDPTDINRAVWSDDFNRVILESDCAEYAQPGVATLRYTVTETQPHGGIFDPCLDLYVYQGDTRVRTLREEGCGEPFLARGAPEFDAELLKYQLRAFWDLKTESGAPVPPGTYTIFGRFYLYYDPVVSIDVTVR